MDCMDTTMVTLMILSAGLGFIAALILTLPLRENKEPE